MPGTLNLRTLYMVEILVGYLLFFLFVQTEAGACQKFSERNVAEQACKRRQACTNCSDFNFGDDCTSNRKEHCAEIGCCPVCETEIRAMFACEHGDSCGKDFVCGAACPDLKAKEAAEQACKRTQACTNCSDFNFGDDCASNRKEHCAEIGCCPVCETEIRAMFACEHGDSCGKDLACGAVCDGMEAKEAVEQACRAKNGCADCDDFNFNFGDDCTNNRKGHCIEIGCCPECEKEIRASYACEHGDWCGRDFVCNTTITTTTMLTVDGNDDNDSWRSSDDLTYILIGASGLLVMAGVTLAVHVYCKANKGSDVAE